MVSVSRNSQSSAALPLAPEDGEHANEEGPGRSAPSLAFALLLGLLGGLILNLMPCVLPVLAIKIFAISDTGKLNVITAKADWEQLATIDLQQDAYATPAIAHGRLYVRTVSHLWCFGKR